MTLILFLTNDIKCVRGISFDLFFSKEQWSLTNRFHLLILAGSESTRIYQPCYCTVLPTLLLYCLCLWCHSLFWVCESLQRFIFFLSVLLLYCTSPKPRFSLAYVIVFFCVHWFELGGICLFFWYLWCWSSVFKLLVFNGQMIFVIVRNHLSESEFVQVFHCLFISVLPLEIQLSI
jgi:hypothetical protein